MKCQIHLVLVSNKSVPNISPILDERFRPNEVVMLLDLSMDRKASHLERIYQPRHIKCTRWQIDDAWNIEHIRHRIMDLLDDYKEFSIALNVTGGTRPMCIAAYEVFRAFEKPIFYVNQETDHLIWMYPAGLPSYDLADRIKLKEYLIANGAYEVELKQQTLPKNFHDLTKMLIDHIDSYAPALSSLNYYAAQANQANLVSPEIGSELNSNHAFWNLIGLFEEKGFLTYQDGRLVFDSEMSRFIVNGGWLELYAYNCCLNLKNQITLQDIAHSVVVRRKRGKNLVINELDVSLLLDNRMYLLECKTKRFGNHNIKHDNGAEVLYKLNSIKDLLGGMQAKAMLVSFNKLTKNNRHRAKEMKIEFCCHRDLQFLEEKIYYWLHQ